MFVELTRNWVIQISRHLLDEQNLANVVTEVYSWYSWPILNIYSLVGNNILHVHFSEGIVFYTMQKTKNYTFSFSESMAMGSHKNIYHLGVFGLETRFQGSKWICVYNISEIFINKIEYFPAEMAFRRAKLSPFWCCGFMVCTLQLNVWWGWAPGMPK